LGFRISEALNRKQSAQERDPTMMKNGQMPGAKKLIIKKECDLKKSEIAKS
jgi:hypothetical protein